MGSCLFKSVYARWAVQYQIGNETWSYYASLLWYHMLSNAKKCVYIIYCYNRIKFLLMTSSVDCNQSCSICVVVLHDVNNSYAKYYFVALCRNTQYYVMKYALCYILLCIFSELVYIYIYMHKRSSWANIFYLKYFTTKLNER